MWVPSVFKPDRESGGNTRAGDCEISQARLFRENSRVFWRARERTIKRYSPSVQILTGIETGTQRTNSSNQRTQTNKTHFTMHGENDQEQLKTSSVVSLHR